MYDYQVAHHWKSAAKYRFHGARGIFMDGVKFNTCRLVQVSARAHSATEIRSEKGHTIGIDG